MSRDRGVSSGFATSSPFTQGSRSVMSFSSLLPTLIGGFLLGFVFSGFNLPLPVPPLAGIIAGLACLAGSTTFDFVRHHWLS